MSLATTNKGREGSIERKLGKHTCCVDLGGALCALRIEGLGSQSTFKLIELEDVQGSLFCRELLHHFLACFVVSPTTAPWGTSRFSQILRIFIWVLAPCLLGTSSTEDSCLGSE